MKTGTDGVNQSHKVLACYWRISLWANSNQLFPTEDTGYAPIQRKILMVGQREQNAMIPIAGAK